jgi:hypothetical protein
VLELARKYLQECSLNLGRVGQAIFEGKALDQLQERLSLVSRVVAAIVSDVDRHNEDLSLHVTLVTARKLSREEVCFIRCVMREVNQRNRTNIGVSIRCSPSA